MDAHAKVCPKCGRTYEAAASFCQKDGVRLQLLGEAPDAYIGQTLLDQFRIEEKIGAGGMGTVYRAEQTTLHRSVAIKILHPELASDPDAVRRFKREARVCTALDHANVVRVFLFGQLPDGSLYIVMEHLRGRSLLDVLSDEAALPVHRALHIVTQICDGVGEAHAHGVVHRDLKPENIVLVNKARDTDFVKVLDFGIARVLWGDDQTMATQTGLVFGTARYISPEGASGERTDARSDVYSLGVLAYQLLSGETPFDAPTPVAMLMKHIHASPPHLRSQPRATHVPVPVADVIMRALAKNPEGRYDDAHAFGDALRSAATRSGFEVKHRRAYSIAPGVHGVDPNAPPARAPEPPAPSRNVPEPTPRMPSAPPPEPAMTTDPIDAYDEVSIPGLRGPKRGGSTPWRGIGFAFAIGLAIVLVAFGISRFLGAEEEIEGPDFDTLAMEARAALGRGDYEGPAEASVEVLTDRIMEARPDHREARRLRGEVARRLSDRAEAAAARGETDEALRIYRRALDFAPEDASIQEAIEALEAPTDPPPAPGVRTRPAYVIEGRELTLLAVPEPAMEVSRPEFVIERRRRAIGAAIAAEESEGGHGYEAQTTVARAGEYELVFRTGRGRGADEMRAPLTVHRDPDRPRPTREPDPPPVTTQGSSWSPSLPPAWNEDSQAEPARPEPARPEPARPEPTSEFPAAPVIPRPTIPPWTGQ